MRNAGLHPSSSSIAKVICGGEPASGIPSTRRRIEQTWDCLLYTSIAGFPVGTSMDTNFCYGEIPATLREKYYEAHDLIVKAWKEKEMFSFNGKYTKLRYVNPVSYTHLDVYKRQPRGCRGRVRQAWPR